MVDFGRLRARQSGSAQIDPLEIFRRLPKPPGINDLYTSQASVLESWFNNRTQQDTVIKLHTGGGKTLVGLLVAQSCLNETGLPSLYLVANKQLVDQTLEKAALHGIDAVAFRAGEPLSDRFLSGDALMVGSYQALFNGLSKFGVSGRASWVELGSLILDDAHAAFPAVRDAFTLTVSRENDSERYDEMVGLFRQAFEDIDRIGTLNDVISGKERVVLEVPYWAWIDQLGGVREYFSDAIDDYRFQWPLIRDELHTCHAFISSRAFCITPIVPGVHLFPAFSSAQRRIYMSATIADDSEIIRTFDADADAVASPLRSTSLAGVSERMILVPENMSMEEDATTAVKAVAKSVASVGLGVVILTSSDRRAAEWSDIGEVAKGSDAAASLVSRLQSSETAGPAVFANRYDGMDLPGQSCRLLILSGLPVGTSDYEQYRAVAMFGSSTTARMLAQRIEQGAGRGSRGSGDHCVVILHSHDLAGWVGRQKNFQFFTSPTQAQLDMGDEVSREITTYDELLETVQMCLNRDAGWTAYHAEKLADLVQDEVPDDERLAHASSERKAIRLWRDGYHENAIRELRRYENDNHVDPQTKGWMSQLAARISYEWGNHDLADELQRRAYAENRFLIRPIAKPPHVRLVVPGEQAQAIVGRILDFRYRALFGREFESNAAFLHRDSSAGQFEEALKNLGKMLGFEAERKDVNGGGPDVLWILPQKMALIIEAKSRKKDNPLTKDEHGQLMIAQEWFDKEYADYKGIRVCVHPNALATENAHAQGSYALTMNELARMVDDARVLLRPLWESQVSDDDLLGLCAKRLEGSSLRHQSLCDTYLRAFETASRD